MRKWLVENIEYVFLTLIVLVLMAVVVMSWVGAVVLVREMLL